MIAKVELKGVKKRFGSKVVLDGVDLVIEKGHSLVVIGGSGTGKIGDDKMRPRHSASR